MTCHQDQIRRSVHVDGQLTEDVRVGECRTDLGARRAPVTQHDAADQLRANSELRSQEYSAPVLGLIFLRFAEVRFTAQRAEWVAFEIAVRKLLGDVA